MHKFNGQTPYPSCRCEAAWTSGAYIHYQSPHGCPGSATLQGGFWSRAGARRSQEARWRENDARAQKQAGYACNEPLRRALKKYVKKISKFMV
jgi:hypothetical protein